ncbi:PTS sugar transporter subunit IIB [Paenibacillus sp. LMG 31459]|uniref:PTS sugar transporter subunit IIB n=1 Tax=Paenibacillus phytohabitans TaxID=2654978 RepID=A0ABX1Y972_9BACL|nr:PTS sugar transporter subunit IIB [Paenibacillus phytohabitans]NOU77488.1 PTS sugar transporter subunit IIB [Paenibacillus phytohabitans]
MKTIMLVCAAGMSTSLLVTKMKKAAESKGVNADIFAIPASEMSSVLEHKNVDAVLLGPQVMYMKKQLEAELSIKNIPIEAINVQDYGMMNGEKVLDQAFALIK